MKKYIEQLLNDLEAAKKKKPAKPNIKALYPDHPALDYGLDYIAEWEMAPQVLMAELFGIAANQFPPAEKLTGKQMVLLVDKILELWFVFNFDTIIPDGVPIEIVYSAIIKRWKEEPVTYISEGHCTLEFCYYVVKKCPWGIDYCTCKDIEEEYKNFKPTPVDKDWWQKGVQHHPGGGTSWINPDLLDEDGNLKEFPKWGGGDDLPF